MLYVDYEISRRRYEETRKAFESMLDEKEVLFVRTQPGAVRFDKVRVTGGKQANSFEEYIAAKEKAQIDERLTEMRSILEDRRLVLESKEQDLRKSTEILDRVYCLRMIDKMRIYKISRITHYSDRQIHRFISCIIRTIKDGT